MKPDKEKQALDALNEKYRAYAHLILPEKLPPDYDGTWLDETIKFPDRSNMTQGQMHTQMGKEVVIKNIRHSGYEKTNKAVKKPQKKWMTLCWIFSLTFFALMLVINHGKSGEIFDKTMNMVPGAAQAKQAMQMQQQQMDAAEQQQRALQQQLQDMLK